MSSQQSRFDRVVSAFAAGEPVLIHDSEDREGETDLVYPAGAVTPEAVERMRSDAGGLICVAFPDAVASAFGLPFLREALDHPAAAGHELGYDERSSFSLSVNHRETFTGVTDSDRALTITELASAATAAAAGHEDTPEAFAEQFRAPGHVPLLRAAPDGLADRTGHTELALALAEAADTSPAIVVCEMLDGDTGTALSPEAARAYADAHGLVYVEGRQLIDALT